MCASFAITLAKPGRGPRNSGSARCVTVGAGGARHRYGTVTPAVGQIVLNAGSVVTRHSRTGPAITFR